jgi:hypothetical protein
VIQIDFTDFTLWCFTVAVVLIGVMAWIWRKPPY